MPSIIFINCTSRDLDNTKILLYKRFAPYLVVKPTFVNAALISVYNFSIPSKFRALKILSRICEQVS